MSANEPMTAVRQYISACNSGDDGGMAVVFSVPGLILDGMVPHLWQGPTGSRDRYADELAEGKQHGAFGYCVTLGQPLRNSITGDSGCGRPATIAVSGK